MGFKNALKSIIGRMGRGKRRGENCSFEVQRELITIGEPVIFDIGAHVGNTARNYRSFFPTSSIHCFEPFPDSFRALVESVKGDRRIHCHQEAVCDREGVLTFHANARAATNSLLPTDERAAALWGAGVLDTQSKIEVRATTLDIYCRNAGISRIDILKMDVQGAEYSVLEGARRLLNERQVSLIYLELIMCPAYVGQRKFHEYLTLLDAHGYAMLDFYAPVRRQNQLMQTDAIFIAPSILK